MNARGAHGGESNPQQGFLLNGQPYPIYGVNRHQEWADKGGLCPTPIMPRISE